MTPELQAKCGEVCKEAGAQGIPLFMLHVTPEGDTRYIGHQLPGGMVARMLRAVADAVEDQMPAGTLN